MKNKFKKLNNNVRSKYIKAELSLNQAKDEYNYILDSKRINPKRSEKDTNKLLVRLQAQKKTLQKLIKDKNYIEIQVKE